MKDKFLLSIHNSINQLLEDKRLDEKRRMELLAFSILTKIDGECIECGPFALRSLDEQGKEGEDIAGNLHHELMNMKDKLLKTVYPNPNQNHTQIVEENKEPETTLQETYSKLDVNVGSHEQWVCRIDFV